MQTWFFLVSLCAMCHSSATFTIGMAAVDASVLLDVKVEPIYMVPEKKTDHFSD